MLDTLNNAASIIQSTLAPEVQPSRPLLPQLFLIQNGSKHQNEERSSGWLLVSQNGDQTPQERLFKSLLVGRIDVGTSRVAWQLDEAGNRVMSDETRLPVCASNDGISPREMFIGAQVYDWRSREHVTIGDKCAPCKLKEFVSVYDAEGNRVLADPNDPRKGFKTGAPICSRAPFYILYIFSGVPFDKNAAPVEVGMPAIFRAYSYVVRSAMEGVTSKRHGLYAAFGGERRGFDYYFSAGVNGETPAYRGGKYYGLVLGYQMIQLPRGAKPYVPTFSLPSDPVSDAQLAGFVAAVTAYRDALGGANVEDVDSALSAEEVPF